LTTPTRHRARRAPKAPPLADRVGHDS